MQVDNYGLILGQLYVDVLSVRLGAAAIMSIVPVLVTDGWSRVMTATWGGDTAGYC